MCCVSGEAEEATTQRGNAGVESCSLSFHNMDVAMATCSATELCMSLFGEHRTGMGMHEYTAVTLYARSQM